MITPQEQCNRFNAKYPVGTPVSIRKDFEEEATITKTASTAYVLSGHTAVIMLEGISGCYLLSRALPIKEAAQ